MDVPENYYAVLGIPIDADTDTLKRAYRQLARRYHPDLAGPEGATYMKRINRAYAVLSDAEKRRSYDAVIGGVIDLRKQGLVRPHPGPGTVERGDAAFAGLTTFSTKGPLHTGPAIHNTLGVISALSGVRTVHGMLIATGSLDGKGTIWQVVDDQAAVATNFASSPSLTVESLRELRFSSAGSLLAGWGRLGLHIWDALDGTHLWSCSLLERAVSAHYSLDMTLQVASGGKQRVARMALPHIAEDARTPRAWGVRGTDIVSHEIGTPESRLIDPTICMEVGVENRQFWAIRMRALSQDTRTLVTLSCANIAEEQEHMAIVRRWDLMAKRKGGKAHPHIASSILVGRCEDCAPPYAATPEAGMLAFVYQNNKIRLCDTATGTYSEISSGTMGGSARLALSPDAQWLAVAREDSEVNEGVIDVWSIPTGQIVQKLYHSWQISALHFVEKQLVVALTDGTLQLWQ